MCKSKDMKNGVARQRSLIAKRCHSGVVRPINPIVTTFNSSHPSHICHIHPPKTPKNHCLGRIFYIFGTIYGPFTLPGTGSHVDITSQGSLFLGTALVMYTPLPSGASIHLPGQWWSLCGACPILSPSRHWKFMRLVQRFKTEISLISRWRRRFHSRPSWSGIPGPHSLQFATGAFIRSMDCFYGKKLQETTVLNPKKKDFLPTRDSCQRTVTVIVIVPKKIGCIRKFEKSGNFKRLSDSCNCNS